MVDQDDVLACLLPVFDSQTTATDARSDKIDPKAAEAAAKAKAKWWRSPELRARSPRCGGERPEIVPSPPAPLPRGERGEA